jgi:hypothetical protein
MQQFNKLSRDTRPQEQPPNTYPFGKNGIQDFIKGSVINEPGFLPSSAKIPYTPIGVIETDRFPVIFSTDNTYSAWGFYDYENDKYLPIVDDKNWNVKIGLSTDRFITGTAQRNYKGELVVAFTDKFLPPMYANLDAPAISDIPDLYLFPVANPPKIETSVQTGGLLQPGAYYVAVKYQKNDGTETAFLAVSSPKIIGGDPNQTTDKGLEIRISSADTNYDKIQLAIVSKIAGKITAVQLVNSYPLQGSGTIFYSGSELTETITLEEVLTPPVTYERVGAIGQLNDALYIADLKRPERINMQKYVNLIRLKWHSKLVSVDPVYEPMKSGEEKSFLHEEAYAFYIRFKLRNGSYTEAHPIPGVDLTAADRAASAVASAEGLTAKKYQVEDTIPSYDRTTRSGYFGKWENENETYPDTPDFDSTSVGGRNLRGKKVLHHRFPSIRFCKSNLYSGELEYGRSKLDMLGISVENVIIPLNWRRQIVGWEIFYAKRSIGNSTVLGQSLLLFGARNKYEPEFGLSTYLSTGGNWDADVRFKSGTTERMRQYVDQSVFRLHAFDVLFNNPSIGDTASHLSLQLFEARREIPQTGGFIEDGHILDKNDAPIIYCLDYVQKGVSPTVPSKRLKAIKNVTYVPNHIQLGKWNNIGLERCLGGNIANPERLVDVDWLEVSPGSRGIGDTQPEFSAQWEETFLTNIMATRRDLYVPFTGQSLVRGGQTNQNNTSQVFFSGDTYICDYSFHTYGTWVSNQATAEDDLYKGTKVVRRFVCECAANLYNRFEDPANQYSKYYPKSPLNKDAVTKDANYLNPWQRSQDPNQFGYTKDSNAQDDLIVSNIFNAFADDITEHPYRIHRGGKMSRQTKFRSWRSWLPLDYYEAQKNMGRITHLEGMDDRLLIHHENALFITQDKTRLESDVLSVTLGTGDIFQFEPQEGLSAKLGYAGTQHELACVRTPFGYVFIDSKAGQIFIYKGQLQQINSMLNTFFQQFLRLKDKNVFTGNGYTIGFDPTYKRLLLTVKNRQLANVQPAPAYTPEMLPTLQPGNIVRKNGRLQQYLGINNPGDTGYQCAADLLPVANDLVLNVEESTPIGTVVGKVTGTHVDNFYLSGDSGPFRLESDGDVVLVGTLNYYQTPYYLFLGTGVNDNGKLDPFTLIINVLAVNQPPVAPDVEVTIADNTPSATAIATVVATDREDDGVDYAIIGGNTQDTFSIHPLTGVVTIQNGDNLDGLTLPRYELLINLSDGTSSSTSRVIVNVTHVNEPPVVQNYTVTIDDNTAGGTRILFMDPAIDREGDTITYSVVSESQPGVFGFDAADMSIRLLSGAVLNPAAVNQYVLTLSASDGKTEPVQFTVTINVVYSRHNIAFAPAQLTCVSPGVECAPGWELSNDQTTCIRTSTIPATITQQNSCLAPSTNNVYGEYGARVYDFGATAADIGSLANTAKVITVMSGLYWKNLNNRMGVWVDTDCNGVKDSLADGAKTTILYNYNNLGAARTIYAGVYGDNLFKLKMNDQTICEVTDDQNDRHFKYLHLFPVQIKNGTNIFNVEATGDGSVNDAVGLILIDNTVAQMQAATQDSHLKILFTSENLRGTSTTIATCPDGYVLDMVDGNPICKKVETTPPTSIGATEATWAKVEIKDIRRNQQILLLDNDQTEKFFQGIKAPYYPPVPDYAGCGGAVQLYLSGSRKGTAQKTNCAEGTGSVVEYVVPAGLYASLESQATADSLAQTDVNTNKQAYANANGICI